MKKNILAVIVLVFVSTFSFSQNKHLYKAAQKSFDEAEKLYKKKNYESAIVNYLVVVENIPISVQNAGYVKTRLRSENQLVEIYSNNMNDLSKSCEMLGLLFSDIETIKNSGLYKTRDLVEFLDLQKKLSKQMQECDVYNKVDADKKTFEKKSFDEEFPKNQK